MKKLKSSIHQIPASGNMAKPFHKIFIEGYKKGKEEGFGKGFEKGERLLLGAFALLGIIIVLIMRYV